MVGQSRLQLPQDNQQVIRGLVVAAHGVIHLLAQGGAAHGEGIGAFEQAVGELLGQHRILGYEAGQ